MKRQNLMIDESLLKEAQSILGKRTFSETVNHTLREAIRIEKLKQMVPLFGSIDWDGDLDEMRRKKKKRSR